LARLKFLVNSDFNAASPLHWRRASHWFCQWRGLASIGIRQYLPSRADSSDFGLLGSKVYRNGRFHAQDAHEPSCKIAKFDTASFIPGRRRNP